MKARNNKKGFTLLEVLVVVIIIGILAALGWSSMNELIHTNRAKEAARTLTAFTERALAEGKMRKESVTINVNGSTVTARLASAPANAPALFTQTLPSGFSVATAPAAGTPPDQCNAVNFTGNTITSQVRIGLAGINGEGCFIACSAGGHYCGSAVKRNNKNTFTSCIRKRSGTWEAL